MSIEVSSIDGNQYKELIVMEESHFVDVKSKEINPSSLTKDISAFANSSGGELYIGIEEQSNGDLKWKGFDGVEDANAHLQVCEGLFPLGQFFDYEFLDFEEAPGLVLKITIKKTQEVKEATNDKPYIRRGAQKLPADSDEARRRLELDKGVRSFEDRTVQVEPNIITNSEIIIKFLINVIPSAEPESWLEKQWLIRDGNPTVAGLLLFADLPQPVIPTRCGVKIYRYETSDKEGDRDQLSFDPITIEGNLYNQIYKAVEKTTELVQDIKILGPEGFEEVNYPERTLHEVITNAAIHRDYSLKTDVKIRIFDNRVEVESPGRLPGHITEENILEEQFSRNSSIVRIINKFPNPPNKDVGEGLNTAFEAMRELRLKDPEIEETENSVIVRIKHETLASPEEAVIEYLRNHDEIQNKDGRRITGINSENTMKNVFYRLRKRDMIERVPGKKGPAAAWQLVDGEDE